MPAGEWLDTYGDFNKSITGEEMIRRTYFFGLVAEERWDTITHYYHNGMTYDAAVICRDDLHDPAASPPVIAQLKKENTSGAFIVNVTEITEGPWTPIGGA